MLVTNLNLLLIISTLRYFHFHAVAVTLSPNPKTKSSGSTSNHPLRHATFLHRSVYNLRGGGGGDAVGGDDKSDCSGENISNISQTVTGRSERNNKIKRNTRRTHEIVGGSFSNVDVDVDGDGDVDSSQCENAPTRSTAQKGRGHNMNIKNTIVRGGSITTSTHQRKSIIQTVGKSANTDGKIISGSDEEIIYVTKRDGTRELFDSNKVIDPYHT